MARVGIGEPSDGGGGSSAPDPQGSDNVRAAALRTTEDGRHRIPFRQLIENSPLASLIVLDDHIVFVNDAAARMLGLSDLSGRRKLMDFVHPDERVRLAARISRAMAGTVAPPAAETVLRRADGGSVPVDAFAVPIELSGRGALHLICLDITERVMRERQLTERATYDPLTGLLRRETFLSRAGTALAAASDQRQVALLVADLNDFKQVNDTHGHLAGDDVLAAVAGRLKATVRGGDLVGRFGGDEFLILATNLPDAGEVDVLISRIHLALADPIGLQDGVKVQLGVSIGAAVHDQPAGSNAEQIAMALLHEADLRTLRRKHHD